MNQRIRRSTLAALLALSASAVSAGVEECAAPTGAPTIPDGASANAGSMAEARDAIRGFVAETQTFLKCLEANEPRTGSFKMREYEELYNGAVDAMKSAASTFNSELRAFKAREA